MEEGWSIAACMTMDVMHEQDSFDDNRTRTGVQRVDVLSGFPGSSASCKASSTDWAT